MKLFKFIAINDDLEQVQLNENFIQVQTKLISKNECDINNNNN